MFRFTIRDVLWLTVLVALAVAWWLDRRSLRSEYAATLRAAELREQKARSELNTLNALIQEEKKMQELIRRAKEARERPAWDAAKATSQELGAPQPLPIPD